MEDFTLGVAGLCLRAVSAEDRIVPGSVRYAASNNILTPRVSMMKIKIRMIVQAAIMERFVTITPMLIITSV